MEKIIVSPSIMTADFLELGGEVRKVEESGAPWLHLDVMDGTFVPNISFGPKIISDIRKAVGLFLDVHLMVQDPDHLIPAFAKAGASCITVHQEACPDIMATLRLIKSLGVQCGVSLKPPTPVSAIEDILDEVDQVLVMSVEPGFGGQAFMESSVEKVKELAGLRHGRRYLINIDGGIGEDNIDLLKKAGVDAVVTGSSFFSNPDKAGFVRRMSFR